MPKTVSERATPETDALRDMIASRLKPGQQASAEIAGLLRHGFRLERQRDALAEALRESMMACDHILLADARDIRDWRNDVLRMQGKMRALLAELEAKR